jgi:hypothetical protein
MPFRPNHHRRQGGGVDGGGPAMTAHCTRTHVNEWSVGGLLICLTFVISGAISGAVGCTFHCSTNWCGSSTIPIVSTPIRTGIPSTSTTGSQYQHFNSDLVDLSNRNITSLHDGTRLPPPYHTAALPPFPLVP